MTERSRIGVLFVCHANMCRSPLAEGVFAHLVEARGLHDRFEIDSAGTWAGEGISPHPLSVEIAREHGIDLKQLTTASSRPIHPDDLSRFEHVLAMDRANLEDIERLRRISAFGVVEGQRARVRLLRAVVDPRVQGREADVPDPIGRGPDAYATVYAIVEDACAALLDELVQA